jgi:hypothetical protein
LWQLKRGLLRGDESADYWQAGKSVATISEELPVADIIARFAEAARASVALNGTFASVAKTTVRPAPR